MRVVPERTGIWTGKLVQEGAAGGNRGLCEVGYTVHAVEDPDAVPMYGGGFVELVNKLDTQKFALFSSYHRGWKLPVKAQNVGVSAAGNARLGGLCR